jgi:hypothetical protein
MQWSGKSDDYSYNLPYWSIDIAVELVEYVNQKYGEARPSETGMSVSWGGDAGVTIHQRHDRNGNTVVISGLSTKEADQIFLDLRDLVAKHTIS